MLGGCAVAYYYDYIAERNYTFEQMVAIVKRHFETVEFKLKYKLKWRELSFATVAAQHLDKTKSEVFELLLEDIDRIQPGLPEHLQHPSELKSKLLLAVLGLPECNLAAWNPAATWEGLCDSLRSSIATTLRNGTNSQYFNN